MKYSGIGGQAVIEGIMMKNGNKYATAVRKSNGEIAVGEDEYISLTQKYKFLALPFIRGFFAFYDSMLLGMKTLEFSASFFAEDEENYKPSKIENFLQKIFGDKIDKIIMGFATVVSLLVGIAIFMLLPMYLGNLAMRFTKSYYLVAIFEGILRIAIFIVYILLVSRMEDIRRTFMYHGAEHKCINCVESGLPLTVENVLKSSKEHKRCGTSFIIIVMMISVIFFMAIRIDSLLLRAASRIALIPIIAGISYEFLRLAGSSDSKIVDLLSRPGMWMQGLTVKEPSADMVEVAIAAVEKVFDWKTYLKENFGES